MLEKCSTAQSFIRTEMTTYRIGTLEIPHRVTIMALLVPDRSMLDRTELKPGGYLRPSMTL